MTLTMEGLRAAIDLMKEVQPPPIAITFKQGPNTLIRVELSPADFALAVTGRLVIGEITRGMEPAAVPTTPKEQREP